MQYTINSVVQMGDSFFFTVKEMAALLSYNIEDKKTEIIAILERKYFTEQLMYHTLCKAGDCIVIGPGRGNKFLLYKNEKIKELTLPMELEEAIKNPYKSLAIKFNDAYEYAGKAYFIGWAINAIVEIDVEKEEVSVYSLFDDNKEYLCLSAGKDKDKLYMSSRMGKSIYEFDLKTKQFDKLGIKIDTDLYGVERLNDKFFGYKIRNEAVAEWNGAWENVNLKKTNAFIKRIISQSNKLWIVKEEGDSIVCYSNSQVDNLPLNGYKKIQAAGILDNDRIWLFDSNNDEIIIINTNSNKIEYYKMLAIENSEMLIGNVELEQFVLNEITGIDLKVFMDMLRNE